MERLERRLVHYHSAAPLTPGHGYVQYRSGWKPVGLWLSFRGADGSDSWLDWCRSADYERGLSGAVYRTEVEVRWERLLVLRHPSAAPEAWRQPLCSDCERSGGVQEDCYEPGCGMIGWQNAVDAGYAGVAFPDWRRIDGSYSRVCSWWNGLDCESVCLWDLTAAEFGRPELVPESERRPVVFA